MRLVELVIADMHLDGGSYGARFSTDDGEEYGLWLQCSRMPNAKGLHHRWLFEYRGAKRTPDCLPVVSGSQQEHELLARLDEFLDAPKASAIAEHSSLQRLAEMRDYIVRREPCSFEDVAAYRSALATVLAL
jgi:hypothetical protein